MYNIPDGVDKIESETFAGCEILKSVKLTVTDIGNSAFSGCKNLKTIILERTKTIGEYAFSGSGITKLNLPEGLEEIGENAFAGCALGEVTVPKTVLKIGNESFSGCPEITIYDTIDPNAKPCTEYLDEVNGSVGQFFDQRFSIFTVNITVWQLDTPIISNRNISRCFCLFCQ